ncbi:MAG: adenylate/guanylate cyclase domain-containing protein [Actinomycetota bacterium]
MRTCASCGGENPENAKFCLHCGAALEETAAPARMERKYATALFADLVGSTTLAEQQDPEIVQSVVGRTFDRLSAEIERYGGHLEKFMGDAVLAVFGIPKSHEDDPERAVRAALEMLAVLSELNRAFADEGKPQLAMRIGIEAGEVLVDLERATGSRDRMLTGDAVNIAARLQSAAEPGHIVVGPSVYAAVKDVIQLTELTPLTLKGKAEPVPAWNALSVPAKRRGERPALGLQSTLIGRDEELTVLKQTLHRIESEGRPALVTLIGPAGVGKSRLVHELSMHVEGLPQTFYWRAGRCLAYGNTSYSALADAVKAHCEVLEDDPADVALEKTTRAVVELFGDDDLAPLLAALVTAADRVHSRESLFEAWRRFLERMAARYPLVLVLEDIHWADDGLLDFIEHAADWAQGPVMLLTLARPELLERRPTWGGGKRNAASIYLEPLTPDEDAAMVDDLLPGEISDELRKLIVDRAEGNPLYTEEIVRMLIDRGVIRATDASRWEVAATVADVDVPRSIQGLIAARLDGLPDEEKALLQDAAVVGRTFWLGSLAALAHVDAGVIREALGRLRVKELIVPHEPSSFRDEPEFSFHHSLLRDGAYDSLPKSLRAAKHEAVAAWAAERAGDRVDEISELIATHRLEAFRYREELGETGPEHEAAARHAFEWARAAGDRASAVWLPLEADRWYVRASDLADAASASTAERITILRNRTGNVLIGYLTAGRAEAPVGELLALATSSGDRLSEGFALTRLAIIAFERGDDDAMWTSVDTAIAALEPLGDSPELADALRITGWARWRRGLAAEAEPTLRRAIEIASRVDASGTLAEATMDLAITVSMLGRGDEAIATIEEARRLARECGELNVLMRLNNNYPSTIETWTSDFARSREFLLEGEELARKAGVRVNIGWLLGSLGDNAAIAGDLREDERYQREAIEEARAVASEPLLGMRLNGLAHALMQQGRLEEARETLAAAIRIGEANPEAQNEIGLHLDRGILAILDGDLAEAVRVLVAGVEQARAYHVDVFVEGFAHLVRTLVELDQREKAESYRDLTRDGQSPYAVAVGLAVDGMVATDAAEGVALLREASDRLEALGVATDRGLVLLDLAQAQLRAGEDALPTIAQALDVLTSNGALGWLPRADAIEAEARGKP